MPRQWLIDMLHDKNLKHSDVANKANINRSYFTQIINNRRRPSPDVAKRIATVLGFPDEWYRLLETKSAAISADKAATKKPPSTAAVHEQMSLEMANPSASVQKEW